MAGPSQPASPPPQRNALCPCGSGLRYKHCHGQAGSTEGAAHAARTQAPYPGWERFPDAEQAALWRVMQDALAAQKAGQLDAATAMYEQVVARAPLTFDALHMLGVVRFQQGDLDGAEALLVRALDLMPGFAAIGNNLRLLQHRKREQEGMYSATAIIADDMLRMFGATGGMRAVPSPVSFLDGGRMRATNALHIVVPGDVQNAAANRNGAAMFEQFARTRDGVTLWTDPAGDLPRAGVPRAVAIDVAAKRRPDEGTVAVFGVNARTLAWLPRVADDFDAIVVALDAHDPMTCVDLIDGLSPSAQSRLRLVARSPDVLAELGLPGAVDAMVFGAASARSHPPHGNAARPRLGVFIPPLGGREDKARWEMLEWLRTQSVFLRLMYLGRLPSPHIEDEDEHLISLVTDWRDWWHDLDGLFYWGAEGRMRQFDRLVFEAAAAGLAIAADGFGDYDSALVGDARCRLFFDARDARHAGAAMLAALRTQGGAACAIA